MIEIQALTKVYGRQAVVDRLSFTAPAGKVTGFLGPNGAGKSTTMRALVGLDRPTSGQALVQGRRYAESPAPLHEVGVLLDASAVHPGRSGRDHVRALALTHGIGRRRVEEVLETVGLAEAAHRRVGAYSLGMRQRLGIAAALVGDPAVLVLDEPVNGLDPEGIRWIRGLLRRLAEEGRTVLLSSHLMSEMALTAEHLVIIGRGRLLADTTVSQMVDQLPVHEVLVRTEDHAAAKVLEDLVTAAHATSRRSGPTTMAISGATAADIGRMATMRGVVLTELTPVRASLEEAFLALSNDAAEFGHRDQGPTLEQHAQEAAA